VAFSPVKSFGSHPEPVWFHDLAALFRRKRENSPVDTANEKREGLQRGIRAGAHALKFGIMRFGATLYEVLRSTSVSLVAPTTLVMRLRL